MLEYNLLKLYFTLLGWVVIGIILGRCLPQNAPNGLGQFLFWIGVPLSILAFLRHANLSLAVWVAPVVAWAAILLGAGFGWLCLKPNWNRQTQGSFLLASMLGNTGYLGYPIALSLVGTSYFGWSLFYDILGTMLGSYSLGVAIGARCSEMNQKTGWLADALIKNPALWSFGISLLTKDIPLPIAIENSLKTIGWLMVTLSLILIGMRLSQLSSWYSLRRACLGVGIKMIAVPLLIGIVLSLLGFTGLPRLAIVLQVGMPPAFATLVISEAYHLDQELTVTALGLGSLGLLLTLPLWMALFGP
ncbi:MAG: AEC family transporter [Leptolyngbyaceae cyanobacterium bins.59]|nr:AEC family transporter [Leptolyngbyaceae cyanobacterium bins.59]